jgi:pantetheine-phosphate adenylyltransferase
MNVVAIYPGSFDPVTYGHMDLIRRAAELFSSVTVAVADATTGKTTLFSTEERVRLMREVLLDLPAVRVESFNGLLVDYAGSSNARVIIRGIRAFTDFEYEFQMALMNQTLAPALETVFLMPKAEYSYVSSSLVREVARLGGDVRQFVAPAVLAALNEKLNTHRR